MWIFNRYDGSAKIKEVQLALPYRIQPHVLGSAIWSQEVRYILVVMGEDL